jgi:NADH dehydrogenase (ubiquinone) 1 alpha subcomplex subunit 5
MRPATRLLAKFLEPGTPTGLAGLFTHPAPRSTLIYLYSSTLKKLQQIPEYSPYRQATEALTKKRLEAIEATKPDGYDAWYDKVRFQIQAHQDENGQPLDPLSHEGRSFVTARIFKREIDTREKEASWDGTGEGTPTLEGPRTREEKQKEFDRITKEDAASEARLPEIDPEPMLSREQYAQPLELFEPRC